MKKRTGENVAYASSQETAQQYSEISREDFAKAVQFIDTDGTVKSGAEAIFSALALNSFFFKIVLWKYTYIPGVAALSEWVYRWVAGHRSRMCHL
jgi:predicted DCC family thiol-disulfide oxidoreductase YuxK